jgi:predicted cupin superfamily sugar epimerase
MKEKFKISTSKLTTLSHPSLCSLPQLDIFSSVLMPVNPRSMSHGTDCQTPEWRRIVQHLSLEAHPEGGFYKRTYESAIKLHRDLDSNPEFKVLPRPCASAIYFLLPAGHVSHLHRIPSDELWHFYSGGPLNIVEFDLDSNEMTVTTLGHDLFRGHVRQYCVRAGKVFGSFPADGTEFSFVGCTVAPGFEFGDFEMPSRLSLLSALPIQFHDMVCRLTFE